MVIGLIILVIVLIIALSVALSSKKKYKTETELLQQTLAQKISLLSQLGEQKKELEAEVVRLRQLVAPVTENKPISVKPIPTGPAKDAFLKNIDSFVPYLDGLLSGTIDKTLWSEAIVSINNQELLDLWRKAVTNPRVWVNVIASWGISSDKCMEFVAIDGRNDLYETMNKSPLIVGKKYKVATYAWIQTNMDGKKSIIKKGIVSPVE